MLIWRDSRQLQEKEKLSQKLDSKEPYVCAALILFDGKHLSCAVCGQNAKLFLGGKVLMEM